MRVHVAVEVCARGTCVVETVGARHGRHRHSHLSSARLIFSTTVQAMRPFGWLSAMRSARSVMLESTGCSCSASSIIVIRSALNRSARISLAQVVYYSVFQLPNQLCDFPRVPTAQTAWIRVAEVSSAALDGPRRDARASNFGGAPHWSVSTDPARRFCFTRCGPRAQRATPPYPSLLGPPP